MDPFQALAYGPVVGEYGRDQMVGAYNNPLGQYDVAVSPDMLKKYPLGSFVTAHDKTGNPIGNYRVADTSYYSPGKPTSGKVEFRDADRSGQVFLSPSATPPPGTGPYQYQPPPGAPPQVAAAAAAAQTPKPPSNFLQAVLASYGMGAKTAAPGQAVASNIGDLVRKVFANYSTGLAGGYFQ